MTDQEMQRGLYRFVLLACLFPPFVGATLMGVIGIYPFPEIYMVFPHVAGAFVFAATLVVVYLSRYAYHFFVTLPQRSPDEQTNIAHNVFRPLPVYLMMAISLYIIIGAILANYSLEKLGYVVFDLKHYLLTFAGLVPVVLISVLPIFFYFIDFIGRYLAPRGVVVVSTTMSTKLMMLGLVTPALVDTVLIAYFYTRTGYFSFETLVLWASLLLLAALGAYLVLRSFWQGLDPLRTFLQDGEEARSDDMVKVVPQSLDELGSLAVKLNQLLGQRDNIQQELLSERQFVDAVLDNAAALVLVLDREGKIQRFNRACEEISQYSSAEVLGKFPWDVFLLPEDADTVRKNAFEALANNPQKLVGRYTNYWISRDGTRSLIDWSNSLLCDKEGEMAFMVSIGIDTTERRRAEDALAEYRNHLEDLVDERTAALAETQNELIRKERLAALGQLTATVSHELRNPLGAMDTSLYVVEKMIDPENEKLVSVVDRIRRNIQRCDHIIDELLDFTRITKLETKDTDIDAWLEEILKEQVFPEEIQLEFRPGLNGLVLSVDANRLRRVIINVVENAVHAMQGIVLKDGPRMLIETSQKNNRIEITVKDNGCGIPDELMDKIFEPLFSTKGFGVGLGMPTVKQIMQQHNGGIEIHSEVNVGTEITLWLPRDKKNSI